MRAYLAIIKDSFQEAIASRVLWILIVGITLVLAALAPVSFSNEAASKIQRSEIRNGSDLIDQIQKNLLKKNDDSAQNYLVSKLSDKIQHQISKIDKVEGARSYYNLLSNLRREWNDIIKDKDFYQEKYWKKSSLSNEAKKLVEIKQENRTKAQTARLNRILIEKTFPKNIKTAKTDVIYLTYFGTKVGQSLPFPPSYVDTLVNFTILGLMSFVGGILGISIGIMVTASIIPNMFEPGSIDLLLSKPVFKPILFLSRFAGACSFILLVTSYLIIGFWLIAGLRFDVWNHNLLLCIPVFLFLFMVYYSVSALTGVIWRNPIVSVVMTLVFWGICFTLGTAKFIFEGTLLPKPVKSIISIDDDTLISLNRRKEAFEWIESDSKWEEVFHERSSWANTFSLLAPIYDSKNQRLITVRIPRSRFQLVGGFGNFMVGEKKNDWKLTLGAATPSNTFHYFQTADGKIRTVSLSGVYLFEGDISQEKKTFKILGFDLAPNSTGKNFKKISPDVTWKQPVSVASHPVTGDLFVYEQGKTHHLVLNSLGVYEIKKSSVPEKENKKVKKSDQKIFSALGNGRALLAFENGDLQIINVENLEIESIYNPFSLSDKPRKAVVSPDGNWIAVTSRNREIWLYDVQKQKPVNASWLQQKNIVTCDFRPSGTLLLIDIFGHTSEYQPETGELIKYRDPPADVPEMLYVGLISPFYKIFPSPGELDQLVAHLLIDPEDISKIHGNEREADIHSDFNKIWEPVWSCLAFLVVMLTVTCVYVSRKDF